MTPRDRIEKMLEKERKTGRILGPFTHEEVQKHYGFFQSNPMGGEINREGSVRMFNDLSFPKNKKDIPPVNSFVNKLNYRTFWDNFGKVALCFQENPGE